MGRGADDRLALIESFLPLAERLSRGFRGAGEAREDLSQVAALALVRAVDRSDPARAATLPAFVVRSVEGELRRHLRDRAAVVRVPRAAQRAEPHGLAVATARCPLPLDEDEAPAGEDDVAEVGLERALVAGAARALDRRERQVVALHFFADRTQLEIARELGVSQAHVSRLLAGALAKMRHRLDSDLPWPLPVGSATLARGGDAHGSPVPEA